MDPEEVEGQDTGTENNDIPVAEPAEPAEGGDGINPAWNDLLAVVPSQLHSQVTPFLKDWDKNYQEGINKVHSQYEPYKNLVENKVKPEDIDYALQLAQAIETDPTEVAKKLAEFTGLSLAEAKQEIKDADEQGQFDETDSEFLKHPKVVEMQTMLQTMAQLLVQQNADEQAKAEDAALAKELEDLKEAHGEFDVDWVITKALAFPETPLEDLVTAYKEHEKGILEKARKPGPKVMKSGGSAPDNQLDVKTLDDKGRRDTITKILEAAHREAQG
jgi:hypothetical protein